SRRAHRSVAGDHAPPLSLVRERATIEFAPDFSTNSLTSEHQFGMVSALPRVLRRPEPLHPHPLVAGARGGSRVVAVLEVSSLRDVEIADELVALRREIDRMEARFAQLAWAGHQRGIGAADGSPSTQAWLRR